MLRESGPGRISPLSIPLMMANAGPAALAMRYGLKGPAYSTVSACAAGADAIGTALRLIRSGDADAAVTGGTEAGITPLAFACVQRDGRAVEDRHLAAVRRARGTAS